jgi:secernin
MCDILISLSDSSHNGSIIFGKNSDRPKGESQVLHSSLDERRDPADRVKCAFLEVPDVTAPLATLGCRPYWCWGYETGLNEAGVVGGNTAIYTRSLWQPEIRQNNGLSGMELLRFGLERGRSAQEAVEAIIELLERYGQWGPAVLNTPPPEGCYENAFLLADHKEAWILETTGRRWVSIRLESGVHALSNQPTIRRSWTNSCDDIESYAIDNKWWPEEEPIDFALAYGDHEHYSRQVSHIRWRRALELLREHAKQIDVRTMMTFLRDHYEGTFLEGPQFHPYLPDFLTICMHDSPAGFTWGDTATSVVVELDPQRPSLTPFWCCYQPPCSSIYLPYFMNAPLPGSSVLTGKAGLHSSSPLDIPADEFAGGSLWWRLYRVIDAVRRSPADRLPFVRSLLGPVEEESLNRVMSLIGQNNSIHPDYIHAFMNERVKAAENAIETIEREWTL